MRAFAQQADSISIEWLAAAGPVDRYEVWVEINGDPSAYYATVTETKAQISGSMFQVGDALRFQIIALAADGRRSDPSPFSDIIFFRELPTPQGFIVTNGSVFRPTALTWSPVQYATLYAVFRSTAPGVNGTVIGQTGNASFEDSTALIDVDYFYSIVAVKGRQVSAFTSQIRGRRGGNPPSLVATPQTLSYTFGPREFTATQTFELRNAGDWELAYSAWSGAAQWLRVTPSAGALDKEVDTITLTYSVGSLPAGTYRTFVWLYSYYDAADGQPAPLGPPLEVQVVITIPVRNQAPVIETPLSVTVREGEVVSIPVRATDPDPGDVVDIGVGGMPPFMSFQNLGGGQGTITLAPGFEAAGTYTATVAAWDSGLPAQFTVGNLQITVTNVNRPPVASAIPPQTLRVGETTQLLVTAFDPDVGDRLAITSSGLPAFATFRDLGNGTGEFTFAPTSANLGSYLIVLAIVDSGTPAQFLGVPFQVNVTE